MSDKPSLMQALANRRAVTPVTKPTVTTNALMNAMKAKKEEPAEPVAAVETPKETPAVPAAPAPTPAKPSLLASTREITKKQNEAVSYDHLFDSIPTDFQEVLNRFDTIMQRDHGTIDINLPRIRDYVMRIMEDLRENPEYEGMLLDRDVRNVIGFIRRTSVQAANVVVEKQVKSAKKVSKAAKSGSNRFDMDLDSFDLGAASPVKALGGLTDLSNIEF
jgi:hypothetical protein